MGISKKVFVQKTYSAQLYKWSPDTTIVKKNKDNNNGKSNGKPYYCTATPNSQGEDWITTYCYNIVVLNGQQQRIAYVACDYVE
jgi:hypothetical protein